MSPFTSFSDTFIVTSNGSRIFSICLTSFSTPLAVTWRPSSFAFSVAAFHAFGCSAAGSLASERAGLTFGHWLVYHGRQILSHTGGINKLICAWPAHPPPLRAVFLKRAVLLPMLAAQDSQAAS